MSALRDPRTPLWAVLAPGLLAFAGSVAGQDRSPEPVPASAVRVEEAAAWAGEERLARKDLERLLLQRHAFSEDGREILRYLVQTRVIDELGAAGGVKVGQGEINALWDRVDREAKRNGLPGGMLDELRRTGVSAEEFRELLRLQIIQQVLTRRSLGLAANAEVSGDQMAIWIESEIDRRGLEVLNPPWSDGVIAHCGEVRVALAEFGALLARRLPPEEVEEASFHALLLRGIEARMPDLSAAARAEAIEAEIARRRKEVEGDSAFKGLDFEDLLSAQGLTLASLREDPAVAIAALSDLWMSRTYDEAAYKATYEAERELFEARYGVAVEVSAIFLRAAKFKNKWNKRTFEEAEADLEALKPSVADAASFAEHARTSSEDPRSQQAGGALGWITRGGETAPPSVREAVFARLDTGGPLAAAGELLGPVRLDNGVVLLFASSVRKSPAWEEMRAEVRQELRRRFLDEVLEAGEVRTFRTP